ncbi:class I SAM-dependent methyltransferase [Mycobacterium frederiksbergense]|uniref:class I SAM-dependent methyltransferase n=1 Tax=Mycolicibacterium frederiksbergense TaxID=117567 RepID=UPI0021F3B41A|nr:class I SAM-dependent methyltransferase [Mycolicibacterium frederiksbergense]MCV7043488.1 class I SAM-dependent methyltransferase [Mycolicibacterium frederiksbergense]
MGDTDRARWDAAYAERSVASTPALPAVFVGYEDLFPRRGTALEIACGAGAAAVWLAQRGLDVHAVDVSQIAIGQARVLAEQYGVTARFDTVDLDGGLPPGDPADLVLCHKFREPGRYADLSARLRPGGLLAICVLSEVGADPGRFRAVAGELRAAFAGLDEIAAGEGDGQAWLLARRR